MRRRFRFTGDCLERLRSYCAKVSGGPVKAKSPAKADKAGSKEPKPEEPAVKETKQTEPEMPREDENAAVITRTNVGKVRQNNQDAVINGYPVIGIADGMGGHKGGEVASATARDVILEELKEKEVDGELLCQAIETANRKILLKAGDDDRLAGMGTTVTVLWVGDKQIKIGHVGDSRAYRFRDDKLEQITNDHSMVAEMVRQGLITQEQADNHPMKNIITRAVGTDMRVDVDVLTHERRKDDRWLICSDGLSGMVSDERLAELLRSNTPGKAADKMLEEALEAGGRDNISFVIYTDKEDHEA